MKMHPLWKVYPLLLLLLGACSSVPSAVQEAPFEFDDEQLFADQSNLATDSDIHRLDPLQEQAFWNFFRDPSRAEMSPANRVAEYLRDKGRSLDYYESPTNTPLTAAEIVRFGRGDCYSQAILTTTFARLAGVRMRYQGTQSSGAFQPGDQFDPEAMQAHGILIDRSRAAINRDHRSIIDDVNVFVDERVSQMTPDGRLSQMEKVSRLPANNFQADLPQAEYYVGMLGRECSRPGQSEPINYSEYVASYYLSLAATAINEGEHVNAYWLTLESLDHNPHSSAAYGLMAAIHRGLGDEARAELIYQTGIEYLDDKLYLLRNYEMLLVEQGRTDEAQTIAQQISGLENAVVN